MPCKMINTREGPSTCRALKQALAGWLLLLLLWWLLLLVHGKWRSAIGSVESRWSTGCRWAAF